MATTKTLEALTDSFKRDLEQMSHTPDSVVMLTLDLLEASLDNEINIVDPSSPFMFLLESSATHASAALSKFEVNSRKNYARLAKTMGDLYDHMADEELLDRFATPPKTNFILGCVIAHLKNYAVLDPIANVYRIIIPKDTFFTYGGYSWMIHYPIHITINMADIIQVSYDFSATSPIKADSELTLNYQTSNIGGTPYLLIDLPVEQIAIRTETTPVAISTPFSTQIPISDNFYYLRAYWREDNGEWNEMSVTHSSRVYDVNVPTMHVAIEDGYASVFVPDVYTINRAVGDQIRVDLFTTSGDQEIDLSDYSSADASITWLDLDGYTNEYDVAPAAISTPQIYAVDTVVSGRAALSFDEVKDRVIYRSTEQRAAITPEELRYLLEDRGYVMSTAIDTITGRLFTCSRDIPAPARLGIPTPIGIRNAPITLTGDISEYQNILYNNVTRITVSDQALFREDDYRINVLTATEVADLAVLKETSMDVFLREMNDKSYFYNPFFYVLDRDSDLYQARPYHLGSPSLENRRFMDTNRALPFALNTTSVVVKRDLNVYTIEVTAAIINGVNALHAQLQFVDSTSQRFHLHQKEVNYEGSNVTFTFELTTSFDIDGSDRIEFTNMISSGLRTSNAFVPLIGEFDLLFYKDSQLTAPTEFDYLIQPETNVSWVGVGHDRLRIKFGESLEGLHARSEPVYSEPDYLRYTEDQYLTYPKDTYLYEDGRLVTELVGGVRKPVLEHSRGDYVLDSAGNPIVEYSAGEIVYINGEPILNSQATLIWSITIMALDARYWFAETENAVAYRTYVADLVLSYLNQDLRQIEPGLAARTELEFMANSSTGTAAATVDSGIVVTLDTALSFAVVMTLEESIYRDDAVTNQLRTSAKKAIREALYTDTYANSEIVSRLQELHDGVTSVSLDNPIRGYDMAVTVDKTDVFSVRSKLFRRNNGLLDVEDDIVVNFVQKK